MLLGGKMEQRLTLESMMTLAGVVAFVEVMLQAFVKPALKGLEDRPWYGLAINGITVIVGFVGSIMATWAGGEGLTAATIVSTVFRAIEAMSIAVAGYEIVKHLHRARKGDA